MSRTFKFELKRAFASVGFWVAIGLGMVIVLSQQISFYFNYRNAPGIVSAVQAFIGCECFQVYNTIFFTMFPILAAMPFAASYYIDLNSGYIKNICTATSRKQYFAAKYMSVFISAFIVVVIPLIVNFMIAMTMLPLIIPEKFFFKGIVMDSYIFSYIYNTNPGLYVLIYIALDGLFAGLLADLALCIAEFTESSFITLTFPFAFYMLSSQMLALGMKGNQNFSLNLLLNPYQVTAGNEINIIIIAIIIIMIILANVVIRIKRKDIL